MQAASQVELPSSTDREAWLAARRGFLTASEVAVALGLKPGRAKLVREKAGKPTAADLKEEAPDDFAQVAAGRHLEEGIFAWFKSETIHTTAHMCGRLTASSVEPRLAATPDAILDGDPVELKMVGESALPNWHAEQKTGDWFKLCRKHGWDEQLPMPIDVRLRLPRENNRTLPGARDPRSEWRRSREHQLGTLLPGLGEPRGPIAYWCQLMVQIHVLHANQGWLVGVVGGTRRYDFLYARDRAFEQVFLAETQKFWADVEALKEREAA